MGKTIKKVPCKWHRQVRGNGKAKREQTYEEDVPPVRSGAIPPSPYDDIKFDPQTEIPFKVIRKLMDEGISPEESAKKVSRKFKIEYLRALQLAEWYARWEK